MKTLKELRVSEVDEDLKAAVKSVAKSTAAKVKSVAKSTAAKAAHGAVNAFAQEAPAMKHATNKIHNVIRKKIGEENETEITEKGPGLWANIRAKRQRIKSGSGERMKKPGEKGAPSPEALQKAKGTSEGVAEAAFKDPSPMMKDAAKEEVEQIGYLLEYPEDLQKMKKADSYKSGDKVFIKVGGKWHKGHVTTPLNKAGNHGVKFQHGGKTHSYVSSPEELRLHVEEVEGVAEAAFKDPSPMMKDSIKQDKIRSLKNLIAIAKVKGVHHKVKELELELKKLQEMTEASKPRTPMRDFLRRYPVPKDQMAKPVKKEKKQDEKKVEEQHPEDMKIPSNKLEPEGTKKWLAIHGKHLKYLKNLKKAPAYEEKEINEAEGGEGGGTAVPAAKSAMDAKKRAQLLMKSADLKLKQEREREKLRKEREAVRSEEKVPEFKSGGKPLARKFEKAMAAMGIKTKIKMRTVNNISMNEMFSEAMKKEKTKDPSSKDKMKKGEALSGKKEPIDTKPELNPTK